MTSGDLPPSVPELSAATPSAPPAMEETATSHVPVTRHDDEEFLISLGSATEHMTLLPGYELLGLLGRGGTSVVYKARHSNLRRLVALKMILGGANALPEQLMRFRIEAETVAKLQHPNIVQIYEVGVYESCIYLALEYVEGETVADKYHGQPAPAAEAARLVEAMARGVQHAHERGVVHRDLKPANVLLTVEGTPKIADFGLAKHVGSESMPSLRISIQGTPSYMAPEQTILDKEAETKITTAVDIYALGAILYELLTGQPPFLGEDLRDTMRRVAEEPPTPPRKLNPAVPADLEHIVLRCLQKDPHQRYPTAEMLADDLRRFLNDQPVAFRPLGMCCRLWSWCRRHPRRTGVVAAVLLLWSAALGGALGLAWRSHQDMLRERLARAQTQAELRQWQGDVRQLLDYSQLLQQKPDNLDTLWQRARLLHRMHEHQLALADCQKLLAKLDSGSPLRPEVQAMVRELLGNIRPAPGSRPD